MKKHLLVLHLPYLKPPLSLNDRDNRFKLQAEKKALRDTTTRLCRYHNLPKHVPHAEIHIVYTPAEKRIRDPSNLMPTQKAVIDGLKNYGLVLDDNPTFVTEHMPVIETPDARRLPSRLRVEILTWLPEPSKRKKN